MSERKFYKLFEPIYGKNHEDENHRQYRMDNDKHYQICYIEPAFLRSGRYADIYLYSEEGKVYEFFTGEYLGEEEPLYRNRYSSALVYSTLYGAIGCCPGLSDRYVPRTVRSMDAFSFAKEVEPLYPYQEIIAREIRRKLAIWADDTKRKRSEEAEKARIQKEKDDAVTEKVNLLNRFIDSQRKK